MRRHRPTRRGARVARLGAGTVVLWAASTAVPATAQQPPVGRDAALALDFPPLEFDPPEPELHRLSGDVEVLYLEDRALPLVTVLARFDGGYAHFPRSRYAAGVALPALLRNGGTAALAPDSVDRVLDLYALQTTFGGSGESVFSSVNTLTRHLPAALDLWGALLREPRFDSAQVEVWRGQELESVLRREDDPARLAVSTFNHLMYGDHPVGWEMEASDLEPEDLARERFQWIHRRVVCPGRMVLGVTGDVAWEEIRPLLERMLDAWPPCEGDVPDAPPPDIRTGGGVFLLPRPLAQSTVVMAHATDVALGDTEEYFASRVANSILGASGFSSRLLSRLRTEKGWAYSASSLWTTPRRSRGLVGALTRTSPETTVAATRLALDVFASMAEEPPSPDEVRRTVSRYVNGFVFNFDSPSTIVSRQMAYRTGELPPDWLERYLHGLQEVEPDDVLEVVRRHVRPAEMTILVVGDPDRFGEPLEALGAVTVLDAPSGRDAPASEPTSSPSGSPRSRR